MLGCEALRSASTGGAFQVARRLQENPLGEKKRQTEQLKIPPSGNSSHHVCDLCFLNKQTNNSIIKLLVIFVETFVSESFMISVTAPSRQLQLCGSVPWPSAKGRPVLGGGVPAARLPGVR